MMTTYTIIGVRNYNKVMNGFSKIHALFLLQTGVIIYLAINELTNRNIHGLFLIYLFTQYSLFLTFCIVIDSCLTSEQKNDKQNKALLANKIYRAIMHVATWGLFVYSFWMKDCYERIYPFNFILVSIIILTHQAYDIWLERHDYMIDFNDLPPKSPNNLRFNPELFRTQTKFLFYGNLIFGIISMTSAAAGWYVANQSHDPTSPQHLLCYGGTEWVYMSNLGNLLGTTLQALILMQINITQFVLVKTPRNMGLFEEKKVEKGLTMGLRANLLA